jgi:hypothetical protein
LILLNLDKIIEFRNTHFKNTEVFKDAFVKRMITLANDCLAVGDYIINLRTEYEKYLDKTEKDEIGTQRDKYKILKDILESLSNMWYL